MRTEGEGALCGAWLGGFSAAGRHGWFLDGRMERWVGGRRLRVWVGLGLMGNLWGIGDYSKNAGDELL